VRDRLKGMVVRRTDGLLRIAYHVTGLFPDTWSGRHVTYTRPRCVGGTLTVELASDENLFGRSQTVSGAGKSVTFDPSRNGTLTVPLRPTDGTCRVVFTVAPTAVPALTVKGSADTRVLGAHFLAFRYSAP
jgi:hypothetical protein